MVDDMNSEDERSTAGFLSPQPAYDEWAEHYDEEDPSTLLDQPFLLSVIQPFEGCRILDLGCGTGRYLRLVGHGIVRCRCRLVSRHARASQAADIGHHRGEMGASVGRVSAFSCEKFRSGGIRPGVRPRPRSPAVFRGHCRNAQARRSCHRDRGASGHAATDRADGKIYGGRPGVSYARHDP